MFKISIMGATGRMGKVLIQETLLQSEHCELVGATAKADNFAIGQDIGSISNIPPTDVLTTDCADTVINLSDCIIDFTTPKATMEHLEYAIAHKTAMVIGTTGLNTNEEKAIASAAKDIPIVYSANMSIGVNILLSLVEQTASILNDEFDIEIFEAHHKHKADAPSGTALALGKAAAQGRNIDLNTHAEHDRNGRDCLRTQGNIGFSVMRGGNIAGEHNVIFAGNNERIEIGHRATDRSIFAHGAVRAALWIDKKTAGLYSMKDVLNL